jgi:hypothetical protein
VTAKHVFAGILLAVLPGLAPQVYGQASMPFRELITTSSYVAGLPFSASDSNPEAYTNADLPKPSRLSKPVKSAPSRPERFGAFSSWTIAFKANTLGAGIEIATPLSRNFGLRGQGNFLAFDYLFSIDGVDYDSRFNLQSGSLSFDWYPTHHKFRISPGVLYFKNNLTAISGVPPGNYFELGSQGFINSVDDPLNGTASVIFPRHVAPMVTFAYNLIGKRESRFTMPLELGVAYTGAAKIDVTLDGTACTNEGCFAFSKNQEAQDSLKAEIQKLNRNLATLPIYPIVSIGFAYRFGH